MLVLEAKGLLFEPRERTILDIESLKIYEAYETNKIRLEKAKEEKTKKARKLTKKNEKLSASDRRAKPLATGTKSYEACAKGVNRAAKAIESRINQLQAVDRPLKERRINFSIPLKLQLKNKYAIIGRNITKCYGEKILFEDASFDIVTGKKTAILGRNGAGKTTLMKMLINEEAGIVKSNQVKIGYFDQMLECLDENMTVLQNVAKDSLEKECKLRRELFYLHPMIRCL